MRHDEHFLERLERLDREHAEIALGLYYDSVLVKHVLQVAGIPDDADRVALCLGTPEQGPFLIVARDGHFVTCLGEGMQLQPGQPLISRHRLDTISESVSALRSLVADAGAGKRQQTTRTLERALVAGSHLSQEEFESIARWLPVLAIDFLRAHMDATERCHLLVDRLSRIKRLKRRDDELLHEYWRSAWSIAHFTMLLGSDGGTTLRELFAAFEATDPGFSAQLAWCLVRLGVSSFAVRGAWAASKMPALVLPTVKRRYLNEQATFLTTLTDSLSLAALGLRNRKYHGEVRKTLDRGTPPTAGGINKSGLIRNYCSIYFDQHSKDPQTYLDHTIEMGRTLVRHMHAGRPQEELDWLDQLPSEIPVAMLLTIPHTIHDGPDVLRSLFERLPWIVSVEAKSFYLPEPLIGWVRIPWTPFEGTVLLDARKEGGIFRPQPVVAAPKIGRNEACPCGSGKKYKRCCGGPNAPTTSGAS